MSQVPGPDVYIGVHRGRGGRISHLSGHSGDAQGEDREGAPQTEDLYGG